MAETRLAHFDHHWEAELARGWLEDAGVPSRLVSDNLAGGYSYMGNLSGASLLVATETLERATRVLTDAGVLGAAPGAPEPGDANGSASAAGGSALASPSPPPTPLVRADRQDLQERLAAAKKAEVRHFIRCMLGVSPTAVIPIVGLAIEGNVALLALLCVLVVLVEGWQWIRAGRLVKRLREELAELDSGAPQD